MHAPAEFQLTVSRFGAWRGGLAVSGLVVWGSALAWWMTTERPLLSVAAGFLLLACGAATASLHSLAVLPGFMLRWDGGQWHLGQAAGAPSPGSLQVAIDGGRWLLLRFVPDAAAHRPAAVRWLPVQRSGLEHEWHLLRSTLFTARPAVVPEAFGQDGRP
jgi:hypothetical protein